MLHAFDPKTIQRMSFEEPAAVQETKTRETTTKTRETTTKTRETTTTEQEKPKKKKSAREQLDTTSLTKPTKVKSEVGISEDKRH